MKFDMRIPLVFASLADAGIGDAVLYEGERLDRDGATACFQPAQNHAAGCACCTIRSPAARALTTLLHARARGETAFFRHVVAILESSAARKELDKALETDAVISTCYRK